MEYKDYTQNETNAELVNHNKNNIISLKEKVDNVETPDLSNYPTTTEMNAAIDAKIAAFDADGDGTDTSGGTTPPDLSAYSTTSEMNAAIDAKIAAFDADGDGTDTSDGTTPPDLSAYSTTTEMNAAIDAKIAAYDADGDGTDTSGGISKISFTATATKVFEITDEVTKFDFDPENIIDFDYMVLRHLGFNESISQVTDPGDNDYIGAMVKDSIINISEFRDKVNHLYNNQSQDVGTSTQKQRVPVKNIILKEGEIVHVVYISKQYIADTSSYIYSLEIDLAQYDNNLSTKEFTFRLFKYS